MSPDLTPKRADVEAGLPTTKLSNRRYPVQCNLRYKVFRKGCVIQEGSGQTCEFSAGTVTFKGDQDLPPRLDVELSLEWPLLLDGVRPLQLVIFGRIIRSSAGRMTVNIARYEFRTRSVRGIPPHETTRRSDLLIHDPYQRHASRTARVR